MALNALDGATTFNPGQWEYQLEKSWLCWAATCDAAPLGPLKTIGQLICPPDIYKVFAAELIIWSIACIEKLKVINSTIGLNPLKALPTANAVKPCSEIGVSRILEGPNSSSSPWVTLYAPSYSPTSSPITKTDSFFLISSAIASLIDCLIVIDL